MLATQREILLRHVDRERERERETMERDFYRPLRVPGSSRVKIGHTHISL